MTQRLRGRAVTAVAAGLAASCVAMAAAGPALADTVRNGEWWLSTLHVTQAWLSSRGTGVTVAVLDTGVDPAQPDLAGSVTTGRDFTGSGRAAGGPFWGVNGTAVASLIAGHGHGPGHADGIIGIAPQAKILSVRVTLENNDPLLASPATVAALPRAIARGIRYAVRHGAQVIDLPLDPAAVAADNAAGNGAATTTTTTTTGGSPAERAAVAFALSKGVVLVAPAGDGGGGPNTVNYPAAYPGVISVGAFSQTFAKAPFTSTQRYVTLTGPGNGVIAANGTAGYAKLKSTTAASAVVAGIAALFRAQFPTLTPAQIAAALTSSTVFHPKGGRQDGSGFGTVDAAAALAAAAKINATLSSSSSPANPTPPAAPKVKVHSQSLWDALRYPVLGLAALLLIALLVLITVRTRQRRALNAELAPLRAAAQAGRGLPGNRVADSDLAPAGAGLGSGVPFGPGGAAVDLAATGRRTVGRAPFDDPDFVPPSFQHAAFGQSLPGPAGAGQGGFGGAAAGGSGFGGSGFGGTAAGGVPFGATTAGLPARGSAAADLPVQGSAAADFPAFGHAAGAPFAGPAGPGAAGPAQPSEAALADSAAFGRPAAADPPVPQLRTLGSAHRLNLLRTPKTTGHPPWEPAEKPEGELPWMDAPARGGAPGRVIPPRPYPDAEPGGPGQHSGDQAGGPRGGSPAGPYLGENGRGRRGTIDRGPFPELDPPPGADPDGPATRRPRHGWSQPDSTDSFPAIRPDDGQLS